MKMEKTDDKQRGLYEKYYIERCDGKSAPGKKHYGCDYFVLDLTHDPYAIPALSIYAEACAAKYPLLSAALKQKLQKLNTKKEG
jgi:hypothetical protein